MSSHHIIRDEQEPAVLVWEGFDVTADRWLPLMEWSPLLWVHQSAVGQVLTHGIKIDGVFCETGHEISCTAMLQGQWPIKIQTFDKLTFDEALQYIASGSSTAVNILCEEIRLEEAVSASLRFIGKLDVVLLHRVGRTLLLNNHKYEKWLPAASKLRIEQKGAIKVNNLKAEGSFLKSIRQGKVSVSILTNQKLVLTEIW